MSIIHIADDKQGNIVDFITAKNIIDDAHKKSLENTLETYQFRTFADKRFSEFLEKRNRIIIPDEDGTLREFVIAEAIKYKDREGHKQQIFARASYLELKKASVLFPNTFTGSASQHTGRALNNTIWRVGIIESPASRQIQLTIDNHTNPYTFLKRIAQEFDLELRFRIEHDGNRITARYVDLLERRGEWRGRTVEFGKDLDGIRRIEKQDIVTALLGLGPEDEDGQRLEVLVEDEEALQRWGTLDDEGNLQHLIEPYEIQSDRSEMTEEEARQYTRTALNKRIDTQISYETTIIDLENVPGMQNKKIRFGDTIRIKDTKFNPPLYLEARIFEQTRSIKSQAKKDIKLGDFVEFTEEEVHSEFEQLRKEIRSRVTRYEMAEYTYDRLTIDNKDETVFTEGKSFAEAVGVDAKEYADTQDGHLQTGLEGYADGRASEAQQAAEAVAIAQAELAETQAKAHADGIVSAEEARAIADAEAKLQEAKEHADSVSVQEAESALSQAKIYAVAQEVYDIQMQNIADDLSERAPIEYVDGQLVSAIEGLEIGGRNLLIDSKNFGVGGLGQIVNNIDGFNVMYLDNTDGNDVNNIFSNAFTMYRNENYIASFWIKGEGQGGLVVTGATHPVNTLASNGIKGVGPNGILEFDLPSSWKRVWVIIETRNWGDESFDKTIRLRALSNSKIYVYGIQFEKGNKMTDWTPAPEDMFSEIEKKADGSTVYTIEDVDNMINNTVSVTQYTADMNGIVTDLNSYGTRIGQNETAIGFKADNSDLNALETSLTTQIGNVEIKADSVITSVSEVRADIDGLEIGGRNLLLDSKDFGVGGRGPVSGTIDGFTVRRTNNTGGSELSEIFNRNFLFLRNSEYVFSFWVRGSGKGNFVVSGYTHPTETTSSTGDVGTDSGGQFEFDLPSSYTRVWIRIKTSNWSDTSFSKGIRLRATAGSDIYMYGVKFEKGNKSTDWSPAPEDMASNAQVTALDASITTLAGEVSLKASQSDLDTLTGEVSTLESELSVLPGQIAAKVDDGEARSIFTQEASSFTFDADQINFDGHVFGSDATFTGRLQGVTGTFDGSVSSHSDLGIIELEGGAIITFREEGDVLSSFHATPDSILLNKSMGSTDITEALLTTENDNLLINGDVADTIVSQGSNSNGNYIRYASGIQICWHHINSISANTSTHLDGGNTIYRSGPSWTFPRPFSETPSFHYEGDVGGGDIYAVMKRQWSLSNTSAGAQFMAFRDFNTIDRVSYFAIGRWR